MAKNTVRELELAIYSTLKNLDITHEMDSMICNFIDSTMADLRYLIIAKEQDFSTLNESEIDNVYIFCTERNMFWRGTHGYTLSIKEAQMFPLEYAKEIANSYNSKSKIVYLG